METSSEAKLALTDFCKGEGFLGGGPAGAPGYGDKERAEAPRHASKAGMEVFTAWGGFGGEEFEGEVGLGGGEGGNLCGDFIVWVGHGGARCGGQDVGGRALCLRGCLGGCGGREGQGPREWVEALGCWGVVVGLADRGTLQVTTVSTIPYSAYRVYTLPMYSIYSIQYTPYGILHTAYAL